MNKSIPVIAIDGTAASGKGTMARRIAADLGYAYLDTGLLYRRVGLDVLALIAQEGGDENDPALAIKAAQELQQKSNLDLNDQKLRNSDAGRTASVVAAVPEVRAALLKFQHEFPARSGKPGAVLDGRDIGTVIFPNAILKFYVDADVEVRARRRHSELINQGLNITFEKVLSDMKIRDARDGGRPDAPMKAAPDAIHIDTTSMTPDQAYNFAIQHVRIQISLQADR